MANESISESVFLKNISIVKKSILRKFKCKTDYFQSLIHLTDTPNPFSVAKKNVPEVP